MGSALRSRLVRASVGLAASGLIASGLVAVSVVGPAQAAAPLVACTWIEAGGQDNRANTTRCTKSGRAAEAVTQRDCWKYQPPENSIVRVKRGTKWYGTDIPVTVRKASRCPDSHPWLTRVKLSTEGMTPYETQAYRLFMPAHEIEVDGETVQVAKAKLDMFVCLMREGRNKTCP